MWYRKKFIPNSRSDAFHKFLDLWLLLEKRLFIFRETYSQKKKLAFELDQIRKKAHKKILSGEKIYLKTKIEEEWPLKHKSEHIVAFSLTKREGYREIQQEDLSNLEFYSNTYNEVLLEEEELLSFYLIKMVALFEFYLEEVLTESIKIGFIKDKEELKKINSSLEKQTSYLIKRGLKISYLSSWVLVAVESVSTRNLILHKNGIIDSRYLNRTKNRARGKIGKKIKVNYRYVYNTIYHLSDFAKIIDDFLQINILKVPLANKKRHKKLSPIDVVTALAEAVKEATK